MTSSDFSHYLTTFLAEYLPAHRNMSPHTIRAYRDTFVLFLRYCRDVRGMTIESVTVQAITAPLITDFLAYLEQERRCRAATRNQRLAALHAFFRYVQIEAPEAMRECQRILLIPTKRAPRPEVGYLSVEDMAAVLRQPGGETPQGRRDTMLLSLLYNTGARVQELVDLVVRDVRFETPTQVRLTGKGRKVRIVPLLPQTAQLLHGYLEKRQLLQAGREDQPIFQNRYGAALTRSGVRYLVQKYVGQARDRQFTIPERVSPHSFRHTKEMHLLESGNPLVVIRNLLGHADVKTTEVYAKADLRMKREALERAASVAPDTSSHDPTWLQNWSLLEWLKAL
ncbi:MAG: site-specific integrase [Armatimonadota bacterium]